jgi:DNA-binding transcriptional MerR regulator
MAKSREAFRTISEVADWLDVQTHVLRFWESKFSQVKPVKRAGGRRYYRPQDMELLGGLKKLLHEDGLPIKDAQQLLREKGVKHVSSLSRPVDQDQDGVTDVAAEDSITPPEDDSVQQEISPPEDVGTVDVPEAIESPMLTEDHQNETASENPEAEVPSDDTEAELDKAPDNTTPDLPDTPTGAAEADDDFLDDLLVKVDHKGASTTSEPEIETKPQTTVPATETASSVPAEDNTPASSTPEQQALFDQGKSDQTPPMDDLFASVDASAESTRTGQSMPDDETLGTVTSVDTLPLVSEAKGTAPQDNPADMVAETADADQAPDTAGTNGMASTPGSAAPPSAGLKPTADALPINDPKVSAPAGSSTPAVPEPAPIAAAKAAERPAVADSPVLAPDTASSDTQNTEAASNAADKSHVEAMVARENTRDDFLQMLTKPVIVDRKDASRAADLLARLEALHSKAG